MTALERFRCLHDDGETILMVTHGDEVAAGADRIISMRDGRVHDTVAASAGSPVG